MEKIRYLFKRVVESEELAYVGPAIAKAQKIAGMDLNSLNGLLAIADAFSIRVIFEEDLPDKIGGNAQIIDGVKFIFLNPNYSHCRLIHTLQHELGHHLLDHLYPDGLKNRIPEFEAQIFAVFLFLFGIKDEEMLTKGYRENPEILVHGFVMAAGALSLLAAGVIWELVDWGFNKLNSPKI